MVSTLPITITRKSLVALPPAGECERVSCYSLTACRASKVLCDLELGSPVHDDSGACAGLFFFFFFFLFKLK